MVKAAAVGLANAIPHLVARGIERDGFYGLEIARALKRAHYPTVAEEVVAATVAAHPALVVPKDLHSLVEQRRRLADRRRASARRAAARQQVAAASAYQDAGLDDDATAALKRAIALDPNVPIPDSLKSPERNESFWNTLRGHFGPWLRTITEMLIAALAIAVLALLIGRIPRRFRLRVAVEPFGGARLNGDDGSETPLGTATSAAVRENYGRMMSDGGNRLKFVSSSAQSFQAAPSQVAEVYQPAGVAAALLSVLDRLVPSRGWLVTGELRPRDPARGAGLTVSFARRYGKVFDEMTLWECDYGVPLPLSGDGDLQPAYDRVALPAAAWVTFVGAKHTIRRTIRRRLHRALPWRWPRARPFRVVGTDDWRSYALFAVGADWQAKGLDAHACRAYHRALGRDDRNRGAAFNLATLELRSEAANVHARGLSRVRELKREIGSGTFDEQWYRVRSAEAVALLAGSGGAYEARVLTVELCSTILDQLLLLGKRWPKTSRERDRLLFLNSVLPSALIFLASTLLEEGRPSGPAAAPIAFPRLRPLLHDLAAHPTATKAIDRFLTHTALVAFVSERWRLWPDDLYNRVCYDVRIVTRLGVMAGDQLWSEIGKRLEEAIRRGGPSLARWARYDPALVPYCADHDRRTRLLGVANEVCAAGGA